MSTNDNSQECVPGGAIQAPEQHGSLAGGGSVPSLMGVLSRTQALRLTTADHVNALEQLVARIDGGGSEPRPAEGMDGQGTRARAFIESMDEELTGVEVVERRLQRLVDRLEGLL